MGPSGDKLSTLHYFFTLAMQLGMVWIGLPELPMNDKGINRLSSYSGVMAQAGQEPTDVAPNAQDKLTGELLGVRVAQYAMKLKKVTSGIFKARRRQRRRAYFVFFCCQNAKTSRHHAVDCSAISL